MSTGTPMGTQYAGDSAVARPRGLRGWVRARSHRAAERAVEGLYEAVRANPDAATGPGAASVTASVLAWLVHLVTLAMVVLAVVLLALTPTHPVAVVPAVLLLGAAWLTRPRPGTEPAEVRWVECAPMLDLVHQIAHAAGAPVPQRVGFDHRLNATYHVVGWRRERLLVIGMPHVGGAARPAAGRPRRARARPRRGARLPSPAGGELGARGPARVDAAVPLRGLAR